MMNAKNKKIKLGVLHMTICFDRNHAKCTVQNFPENSPPKTQPFQTFIPRYGSQRHRTSLSKGDGKINSYLAYKSNQNQSIRYFRQREETVRSSYQRIEGFSPINNTIQVEINDKAIEDEHAYTPNSFTHDTHLKMVYNKKHLRNTIDLHQQRIKTHERLAFNLNSNPEESLKTIFTVRPAKTSHRTRQKVHPVSPGKPYKADMIKRFPLTHRECRQKPNPPENEMKRIRPWSTSKNWQTKLSMFESTLIQNNQSPRPQFM